MDKLYAPWRHSYVTKTAHKKNRLKLKNDCVFCQKFSETDDKKNLIVKRFKYCAVAINAYPYNAGHLLILPISHKGNLEDLDNKTRTEIMEVINLSVKILNKTLKPQGFNIGLNLGEAGGGGIPSHLHFHILPRWHGDTNYLPTIANSKVICSDFYEIYDQLKKEFNKLHTN